MLGGKYECQRTLAIRIAAITFASDSAISIARFRPSKSLKNLTELRKHSPSCLLKHAVGHRCDASSHFSASPSKNDDIACVSFRPFAVTFPVKVQIVL